MTGVPNYSEAFQKQNFFRLIKLVQAQLMLISKIQSFSNSTEVIAPAMHRFSQLFDIWGLQLSASGKLPTIWSLTIYLLCEGTLNYY